MIKRYPQGRGIFVDPGGTVIISYEIPGKGLYLDFLTQDLDAIFGDLEQHYLLKPVLDHLKRRSRAHSRWQQQKT